MNDKVDTEKVKQAVELLGQALALLSEAYGYPQPGKPTGSATVTDTGKKSVTDFGARYFGH